MEATHAAYAIAAGVLIYLLFISRKKSDDEQAPQGSVPIRPRPMMNVGQAILARIFRARLKGASNNVFIEYCETCKIADFGKNSGRWL